MSVLLFWALVVGTGAERVGELVVSRRNAAAALARGGVESGRRQLPWMIALHTALLVGCLVEAPFRPFVPALGWPMLAVALACQAGRYWCIGSLGAAWNTRVIVVPGDRAVADLGPYRWVRHPNYWIVAIEGVAVPLVHTAWVTALAFTVLNAVLLLRFRIPVEERALRALGPP
ncbi:isoprenylcysteine carboxylmethyltransferase family protein [Galbitalea sp. SE-J8]|uniref:isoprenylcysteine carboxyl methyltransferase family protein n=1 Tax=Galbitalea sp. SE-J8 TaxID=3054952 RepID=UPI00259CDD59|nr:isoprenylcysteine carboxylmethyltransferase family protein [Galbitalea sp. SE-J8]MDM4763300.1 isoprenylcysteine carboxylmethyltransferase family protein [Galbitalea sp. SE-J8]